MMAEVRSGRVLVFTKAGEFAFNHVADSQGDYWLADDAESAIAERDAEIERLRSANWKPSRRGPSAIRAAKN